MEYTKRVGKSVTDTGIVSISQPSPFFTSNGGRKKIRSLGDDRNCVTKKRYREINLNE